MDRLSVILIAFLLCCFRGFAQDLDDFLTVDLNEDEVEQGIEDVEEYLENLRVNPANINDTLNSQDELIESTLLAFYQWEDIKLHIRNFGALLSKEELLAVSSMTSEDVQRLKPFIKITPAINQKRSSKTNTLLVRNHFTIEKQEGYLKTDSSSSHYLGNRHQQLIKFSKSNTSMKMGLQMEKDAGEQYMLANNIIGPDYLSAYLEHSGRNLKNKIIVGDYEIRVGQGLVHWNGFSIGKGGQSRRSFKYGRVLKAHSSSNESDYLRGVAAQIKRNRIAISTWVSARKQDAIIDSISGLTSIQRSGLHRTENEFNRKNAINDYSAGINMRYTSRQMNLDLTMKSHFLDHAFYKGSELEDYFDFEGRKFYNGSIHYQYLGKKKYLYGELAVDKNGGLAYINGAQFFLGNGMVGSMSFRKYSPAYFSPHSSAFSERSEVRNESGLFAGLQFNPNLHWQVDSYIDLYSFPWLKFAIDNPSSGYELGINSMYRKNPRLEIQFRAKWEENLKNSSNRNSSQKSNPLSSSGRITQRLIMKNKVSDVLHLKSQFHHAHSTFETKNHGYLFSQDLVLKQQSFQVNGRMALFNTNFDSRIYSYENDVLYRFSIPAYIGQGYRYYGMIKWDVGEITIWLKASQSKLPKEEALSSGLSEIDGNKRSQVTSQLIWKFR